MITAILLKNKKDDLKNCFHILLFEIRDKQIMGMKDEYLYNKDVNYLSLWILKQNVKIIYVQETDEETKMYYKKFDIEIRTYEELQKDPLFKSFII